MSSESSTTLGQNSQGWPRLWANFETVIGISSPIAGPTCEF
jgi:hypothetical protein